MQLAEMKHNSFLSKAEYFLKIFILLKCATLSTSSTSSLMIVSEPYRLETKKKKILQFNKTKCFMVKIKATYTEMSCLT